LRTVWGPRGGMYARWSPSRSDAHAWGDHGVIVVADIELGISSVREVVQAKRQKGSINRRVLDELRGSLHRFSAVRGTVITSGTKQAAFERGAAPIMGVFAYPPKKVH
jgi:hypothetical protein